MVNSYDMKRFSVISLIFSLLFILSCEDKKDTTPLSDSWIGSSDISVLYQVSSSSYNPVDRKDLFINNIDFSLDPKLLITPSNKGYNWSNNGESIVYFNGTSMRTISYKIDFQNTEKIIYNVGDSGLSNPMFSVDDSKIFFIDGKDIKVIDNDGSNMKIILRSEYLIKSFDLSPNGEKIVYEIDKSPTDITVFNWESGEKLQSTYVTGTLPKWLNNNEYLFINGGHSSSITQIQKMTLSDVISDYVWENITNFKNQYLGPGINDYSFSPDRSEIVFINNDELIITPTVSGRGNTSLGTYYDVTEVLFSPDGKYIYYVTMGVLNNRQVIRRITYQDQSLEDVIISDKNQLNIENISYSKMKFQPKYPQ